MAAIQHSYSYACVQCSKTFEIPRGRGRLRTRCPSCQRKRSSERAKKLTKALVFKERECQCGTAFQSSENRQKWCSRTCQRKHQTTAIECYCENCGSSFSPKRKANSRFCSRRCAFEIRKKLAKSPEVVQAREKRIAAYNLSNIRPKQIKHCEACSLPFTASVKTSRCCSSSCRAEQARRDARIASQLKDTRDRSPRPCKWCNKPFSPEYGNMRRLFCSECCANKYTSASTPKNIRKRMRLTGGEYEPINVIKLFERDQWRCQICGCKTPKRLRGSHHERAPEADHRIPISKGGGHTWANVQCACRKCNGLKSNVAVVGQLPLFIR